MSMHFIVRFEPRDDAAREFREALLAVVGPTRAEAGCVRIQVFESVGEPSRFAIHSEWVDEAAFERHARLPHTIQFLAAATDLLTHPVDGLRAKEITGGAAVSS